MPFLDEGGLLVRGFNRSDRTHGLFTAVEPVYLEDPHWQGGIEWESDCSVEAAATLPPCPTPVASKATDGGLVFCSAEPFTVYGSYKCSVGGRPAADAMKIATNRLMRNRERSVERIFWTGITPVGTVNPSLQAGNSTCDITPVDITPNGCALDPIGAIAALESEIVECIPGGLGVLHLNFGVLPYLAANRLLTEENDKYYTPSGQLIVAGAGYPGSGPGNVAAADGESWIFATGPVAVYASDTFSTPSEITEAVERQSNNITFYIEQTYSVIWECCVFAVKVKIC